MIKILLDSLRGFLPARMAEEQLPETANAPRIKRKPAAPLTERERRAMDDAPPSFVNHLPVREYDPATQSLILENGVSCAAFYELWPVPTEGRSAAFIERHVAGVANLFRDFDNRARTEWVIQFFVQDEPDLESAIREIEKYPKKAALDTEYTRMYLALMRRHLEQVARPEGLFTDETVTGLRFRGQQRRIRALIYRRYHSAADFDNAVQTADDQLRVMTQKFEAALRQAGIPHMRRCTGADLWQWMLPWLNPDPRRSGRPDARAALDMAPYWGDDEEDAPYGRDFSEQLCRNLPESDVATGAWFFDGLPHAALTFQGLSRAPESGHLSAERNVGNKRRALLDDLPEGSILSITVTIRAQDKMRDHIDRIKRNATGNSVDVTETIDNATAIEQTMVRGEPLLPVHIVLYVRGTDASDLRQRAQRAEALMSGAGFRFIPRDQDLLALTSYVRGLPAAFDPLVDDRICKRNRVMRGGHLAKVLPLYGRTRGTGRPGFVFFNRGGEIVSFDPMSRLDRKNNAFTVIFGPPGAGKSATSNYLLMQAMANHRPRLFIIDKGGSFNLLTALFKRIGLTVHKTVLSPSADVSLPPFAESESMLAQLDRPEFARLAHADPEALPELDDDNPAQLSDDQEQRDLLGEMEIAARLMITGGEDKEEAALGRAERHVIRQALIEAARGARSRGEPHMRPENVADVLIEFGTGLRHPEGKPLIEGMRESVTRMGYAMKVFCDGQAGRFFNRHGQRFPDADVTLVELGVTANEGYGDQLAIAVVSLLNHLTGVAEAKQKEDRQTIVLIDEAHIVTRNPLLSPYVTKISKMWRKLGTWLWLATQNLEDFPDQAARMLHTMEWWICLSMPLGEIEHIKRFRALDDDTVDLLLAASKSPGQYTEGVVLGNNFQALFRSVPPSLALALAMTEKEEKAERAQIMAELGCDELDAAFEVARRLDRARGLAA